MLDIILLFTNNLFYTSTIFMFIRLCHNDKRERQFEKHGWANVLMKACSTHGCWCFGFENTCTQHSMRCVRYHTLIHCVWYQRVYSSIMVI